MWFAAAALIPSAAARLFRNRKASRSCFRNIGATFVPVTPRVFHAASVDGHPEKWNPYLNAYAPCPCVARILSTVF